MKRYGGDAHNLHFLKGVVADNQQLSRQQFHLPLIQSMKQEYQSDNNIFGMPNRTNRRNQNNLYTTDEKSKTPMSININNIKKGLTYFNRNHGGSHSMRASQQIRLQKSLKTLNQNRMNNHQQVLNTPHLKIHGISQREIQSEQNALNSYRQECWADQ